MTIISVHELTPYDLSEFGTNLAATVRLDPEDVFVSGINGHRVRSAVFVPPGIHPPIQARSDPCPDYASDANHRPGP